ncbi:hypothetical protein DMJ13_20160 [halophilic archaeon]|nr:hypothetical protein DMJ13_20160 [halophilic archaeon]
MRPARFVTLCFVYSGGVLLVQSLFVYQVQLGIASLVRVGVALSLIVTGLERLRRPETEEDNPAAYGPFAYTIAFLCLALTVIVLVQLFAV